MFKIARPLFLHCKTPLHAGTGSDLGYIDLPIQREKHTGFPKVEASSLKGALREVFEGNVVLNGTKYELVPTLNPNFLHAFPNASSNWKKMKRKNDGAEVEYQYIKYQESIDLSFGPESDNSHAGALGFTDARLLLFPVKSLKGIFAWVTCERVLTKFKEELELCNQVNPKKEITDLIATLATIPGENTIGDLSLLGIGVTNNKGKIVLEEYSLDATDKPNSQNKNITKDFAIELNKYLKLDDLSKRLFILSNDEFTDFVKLHTEVITRIKIGDSGTADGGALFNEEFLPTESVLYSLVMASRIFKKEDTDKGIFAENGGPQKDHEKLMDYFTQGLKDVFQLGGDATLGKGIIKSITTLI